MALTQPDNQGSAWLSAVGEDCFYCGEMIEPDPAIEWWGFIDVRFLLHPRCCMELTIRLNLDVYEFERRTGRKITDPFIHST